MSYVHISGWVEVTEPSGPSGPVDPGYGRPGAGHPSHPIAGGGGGGYPSHPIAGGGYPSHQPIKPPGIPIIPVDPDWGVPSGPPSFPGDWVPVDPGYGLPPILGWRPVDPGFGVGSGARPDQGLPGSGGRPDQGLPGSPGHPSTGPVPPGGPSTQPIPPISSGHPDQGLPGHWVPVDPGYGLPCGGSGAHPSHPIWIWIPEIGPDFGLKPAHPIAGTPVPTPKK
jgi:hypothetical protein